MRDVLTFLGNRQRKVSQIQPGRKVSEVLERFYRQGKWYYLFSVQGDPHSFLYFCRIEGTPIRSLIFGNDFSSAVSDLTKDEKTCIECGLGTRIRGGVSLDGNTLVECNLTIDQANLLLSDLRRLMPEDQSFFMPFTRA